MHGALAHFHSSLPPTAPIARFLFRIHSIHTVNLKKIFIPSPPSRTAGAMSSNPSSNPKPNRNSDSWGNPNVSLSSSSSSAGSSPPQYPSGSSVKSANWTSYRDPSRIDNGSSYRGRGENQDQGGTRSYGSSSASRPSTTASHKPVYYNEATKTFNPSRPIRAITPSYIEKSQEKPTTLAAPQKLLVILDLNGTLFYRAKRNNRAVTSRPYLTPFLDFLFSHCQVMVWSSAQPHSVDAMLSFGFGHRTSKLDRVWTRKHFRLPQVDYDRKVLTIKDLEFVWDGIKQEETDTASAGGYVKPSGSAHVEFDQTNTVLIDDSIAKIQLQPYNGLALRDFDEDLARAGTDNELLKVRRYLEKLIYQENVSAYMRLHPYRSDYPLDEAATKEANDKKPSKEQDELADELDDLARRLAKNVV